MSLTFAQRMASALTPLCTIVTVRVHVHGTDAPEVHTMMRARVVHFVQECIARTGVWGLDLIEGADNPLGRIQIAWHERLGVFGQSGNDDHAHLIARTQRRLATKGISIKC